LNSLKMHSMLNRVQNVFGFFTTVAFFVAAMAALSVLWHPASADVSISLSKIEIVKGRPHYYSTKREEYANIRFDLDADLSSLFTWNTKQLFVYVLASYPSNTSSLSPHAHEPSEAIIWDTIIPAPAPRFAYTNLRDRYFPRKVTKKSSSKTPNTSTELTKPGLLNLRKQKPKYQITDITGKMSERGNASLVVGWNVQPWVGALLWNGGLMDASVEGRSIPFSLPPLKGSKAALDKEQMRSEAVKPEGGEASPVVDV